MASTASSDIDRGPSQPNLALEASDWKELQEACYALGSAHGPSPKVAKQRLAAAPKRQASPGRGLSRARGAFLYWDEDQNE